MCRVIHDAKHKVAPLEAKSVPPMSGTRLETHHTAKRNLVCRGHTLECPGMHFEWREHLGPRSGKEGRWFRFDENVLDFFHPGQSPNDETNF